MPLKTTEGLPPGYSRRFVSSSKYLSDISEIPKEELEVEAIYGPKGIVLTREMLSYIVGGLGSGGEPLKAPSATRLAGSQVTEASAAGISTNTGAAAATLSTISDFLLEIENSCGPGYIAYSEKNATDGSGNIAVTDMIAADASKAYRVRSVWAKFSAINGGIILMKVGGVTIFTCSTDQGFDDGHDIHVKGALNEAITVECAGGANSSNVTTGVVYRVETS